MVHLLFEGIVYHIGDSDAVYVTTLPGRVCRLWRRMRVEWKSKRIRMNWIHCWSRVGRGGRGQGQEDSVLRRWTALIGVVVLNFNSHAPNNLARYRNKSWETCTLAGFIDCLVLDILQRWEF